MSILETLILNQWDLRKTDNYYAKPDKIQERILPIQFGYTSNSAKIITGKNSETNSLNQSQFNTEKGRWKVYRVTLVNLVSYTWASNSCVYFIRRKYNEKTLELLFTSIRAEFLHSDD